jgi:hypothetical protein
MPSALTFIATGKPSCSAISSASLGERAIMVRATGMRKADSSALDSISLSTLRRDCKALSTITRAVSRSGASVWPLSGPGTCISNC